MPEYRRIGVSLGVCLLMFTGGCIVGRSNPAATQPATAIDPNQASPDFWIDKPAVVQIPNRDFYKLWNACRTEVRMRLFLVDRQDYREGLLTTLPLVSKQNFEFWRSDVVTFSGIADSSLAAIRRTVQFQLKRRNDGSYIAEPKVLVERYSSAERRLTAINEYHSALSAAHPINDVQTDQGLSLPSEYWYATGRDEPLERDLASSIRHRLGS